MILAFGLFSIIALWVLIFLTIIFKVIGNKFSENFICQLRHFVSFELHVAWFIKFS